MGRREIISLHWPGEHYAEYFEEENKLHAIDFTNSILDSF
jgi:hypothetical protein